MLQYINQKRGQSTLEYAVLIVVVIGALISVQVYIKRGLQGRMKSAADDIGDQYSPGNTNVIKVTKRSGETQETYTKGVAASNIVGTELINSSQNSIIINADTEFWGKSS